ncbi:phosphotransferase [Streptomyces sp. NRRL F-5123]|uniref:phosphotransferase n=1 Tax=Streptomyces sp. NRRL F-5123 TaxID=1463856 RepID=UPI0005BCFEAC|nr:phosphotransferase [Streptomyces sp. NRRL F-5123]
MLTRVPWGDELRAALGVPRRARRLASSPRSRVWRAELTPGTRVVVKQLVAGPGADERYAREVAALRLAARADPPVAARLLATDAVRRVLVLDHLEQLRPGPGWQVPYAAALARLHAVPLRQEAGPGCPAEGEDAGAPARAAAAGAGETGGPPRGRGPDPAGAAGAPPHGQQPTPAAPPPTGHEHPLTPGPGTAGAPACGQGPSSSAAGPEAAGALPAWQGPTLGDAEAFLRLARALGAQVPGGAAEAMEGLVGRLARVGGNALLHGDPCPGNDLHTVAGVRFIDFEQASLGNGLTELAYLRIGFPTCWCVTAPPAATLDAAERAYREAWREATGGEVEGDLADACAGWLLRGDALVERARRDGTDHLREVVRRDWKWGTATARQRLAHRLGVVAAFAADSPELRPFAHLAASLHAALPTSWPALPPLPGTRP